MFVMITTIEPASNFRCSKKDVLSIKNKAIERSRIRIEPEHKKRGHRVVPWLLARHHVGWRVELLAF
jgi:hypothetical protein